MAAPSPKAAKDLTPEHSYEQPQGFNGEEEGARGWQTSETPPGVVSDCCANTKTPSPLPNLSTRAELASFGADPLGGGGREWAGVPRSGPRGRAGGSMLTSVSPAGWQLTRARLRLGILLGPGLQDSHCGPRLLNKLLQITLPQLLI